jgi:hypothetical protein
MATVLGVRGFNPIWYEVDLQANSFDDSFYLFVLENIFPYMPATVYHYPNLTVPWTQPIQFLANGTLPIDIFFEVDKVYRLEFRQGDTQADPLIYEVNDYMVAGGGNTPIENDAFATGNQITNPQFSIINFASPYTFTSAPTGVDIGPGWTLILAGSGTGTITKVPLDSATTNPTNAPYALRMTLSGWDSAYLRQRFQQNGMLWANKNVSSSITARVEGLPQSIDASLYDSLGNLLAVVLHTTAVNSTWTEFTDHGELGDTANTQAPPDAYIEYRLTLPPTTDIFVTSIQLIAQDTEDDSEPAFEQDSIDRQIDHTFHNYINSILYQPKESILSGWDFALNPWKGYTIASTDFASFGYTADQTVMIQQAYVASATGNHITTSRGTAAQNYAYKVAAKTATNQFAMLQYVAPQTARPFWGRKLSSLVKITTVKQNSAALHMKMRLIYRSTAAPTMTQTEPVASWAASGSPVFAAGWTAVAPVNDPSYSLTNGSNTILFEGMQMPAADNDSMQFAILLYTIDSMVSTGTPDSIRFERVSLVCNDTAMDSTVLTFDETLKRCEYYLETSYEPYVLPGTASTVGMFLASMSTFASGLSASLINSAFDLQFRNPKAFANSTIAVYNAAGTVDSVVAVITTASLAASSSNVAFAVNWTKTTTGMQNVTYDPNSGTGTHILSTAASVGVGASGYIRFHYVLNSQIGIVHP